MRSILIYVGLVLYTTIAQAQPQSFSSGSTGVDGALTYAPNLGTVYFPPSGLSPRTNNVYNFTTITIGGGTTVRVSGWVFNAPVYWLATNDVNINGTLDISGKNGYAPGDPGLRSPSEPGAGGYSGGVGRAGTGQNATAGNGAGGGQAPGFLSNSLDDGGSGTFPGNSYLQPLIGGSGGAGGCSSSTTNCGGGGAGGGAILIASSTQIVVAGVIYAYGGNGGGSHSGGGSGGAVRLVSNTIVIGGHGAITLDGGSDPSNVAPIGGGGTVRFEAFSLSNSGNVSGGTILYSIPYNLSLPAGSPSALSVASVNGVSVNANPFSFPDAMIATSSAVPVVISGLNIPPGTKGTLSVFGETGPDLSIPFTLTGTLASTTATVSVPYPSGGSRGFAKVTWTSQ